MTVEVEDRTRVKLDPVGLTPIDLSESVEDALEGRGRPARVPTRTRRAAMFGYRSPGGRLRVETIPGEAGPVGGLVREAFLVSQVFPGAGIRHRLTLKVSPDTARSLELSMPEGINVDRIRRDGQPIVRSAMGRPFRVEIPEPSPGRTSSTLTIDYRTDDDPRLGRLEPARLVPECSLPCLSFSWEIVAPEPWALGEVSRGLVSRRTDPPAPRH